MLIIGINAYHGDSSACLLSDGELIFAIEEERVRRIKHWTGFPTESIKLCLQEAGATLADVEHIAINRSPDANWFRKLAYIALHRPSIKLLIDRVQNRSKWQSTEEELLAISDAGQFKGEVHNIEHHHSHLASGFLVSPFTEAVVASVDGMGDFSSAAWGLGKGAEIAIDGRVFFPHSLGIFYTMLTQFLGFPNFGDEYKVMGMAPYGEPKYLPQMRQIVQLLDTGEFSLNLDYCRHHKEDTKREWRNCAPTDGYLVGKNLQNLFGTQRSKDDELTQKHLDMARSVQAMYEEAFFNLINHLYEKYQNPQLCLAGGCAMNSVANGKIARQTRFKQVYTQAAPGDAGGAIGAAYIAWHELGHERTFVMQHAYLGPRYSADEINVELQDNREALAKAKCHIEKITDESMLCEKTAQAISEGKVIGWFQGRMEWGPRALGNRSILGDPRRADMKDILNLKIKRRESFRPFAPSILREAVLDWFEEEAEVPFMMKVFQIRENKRTDIPAVTHVDGSGRLQTVNQVNNPRYYALIRKFQALTGVPILLNTSFNENEPIVCRPEEALDCFLRTKMDVLVLGDYYIYRQS